MTDLLVVEEVTILAEQAEDTVLLEQVEAVEILAVAEQGPPGPRGEPGPPAGGAGSTYTHTQTSAATVWTIAHNLGRHPSITVVDTPGSQVFPDIRYIDADLAQVTHSTPMAGRAYCN